jgi:hypothetical protein
MQDEECKMKRKSLFTAKRKGKEKFLEILCSREKTNQKKIPRVQTYVTSGEKGET